MTVRPSPVPDRIPARPRGAVLAAALALAVGLPLFAACPGTLDGASGYPQPRPGGGGGGSGGVCDAPKMLLNNKMTCSNDGCHNAATKALGTGGIYDLPDFTSPNVETLLIGVKAKTSMGCTDMNLVDPGSDPPTGVLFTRLFGIDCNGGYGQMPALTLNKFNMSSPEIACLNEWLKSKY